MVHPYMPLSPCGPDCLDGDEPTVGRVRTGLRLTAAACVLLGSVLLIPLLLVAGRRGRDLAARGVFGALLRAFGVRLRVSGEVPPVRGRGALVVTNHVSWLDIAAVNTVRPMRALAKVDIRSWPLLGPLVASAGTVWIDRENLRSLPGTVASLTATLRGGSAVYVCPEGTTWCGKGMGKVRPALFQAALDAGVPVRPIALRYRLTDGRETPAPSFIGDETILESVLRVARLRGLVVEVTVCPEIAPGRADDRRALAALAEASVHTALGLRVTLPAPRRRVAVRPAAPVPTTENVPAA